MKPFNLEEAKAGKPICTRAGKPVTEWAHFPSASTSARVMAVVNGLVISYYEDGRYLYKDRDSDIDLMMAEPIPQNAKPFNLSDARFGCPVVRRNGEMVRIFHMPEHPKERYRILSISKNGDLRWHYEDGRHESLEPESPGDLFMAPQ